MRKLNYSLIKCFHNLSIIKRFKLFIFFNIFNETEYNGPFSLLYVDKEMNVLAELLTIDKENIMISDEFWEKMDRELDEFYEKLMSDIRIK